MKPMKPQAQVLSKSKDAPKRPLHRLVRRRLDEHTISEYRKLAGPFAAAMAAPPMVADAVRRLQADEEELARELQRQPPNDLSSPTREKGPPK